MEKIVSELKNVLPFKDTTETGDIVLIVAKEPQMLMYAKVTQIERDISRKDEWWHIHLSVLSIPLQDMVWTLRTSQMTGMEVFTMGGEERFVKAVAFPEESVAPEKPEKPSAKLAGKITPFKRVK
jgi:hypothetical protein